MNVTQVARIAHEVNRAYCESVGLGKRLPWDEVSPHDRDAAVMNVTAMARGFHTPESLHEAWCREMALNGWSHGKTYSPREKAHPMLMPYGELPIEARLCDALFLGVLRGAQMIVDPKAEEESVAA